MNLRLLLVLAALAGCHEAPASRSEQRAAVLSDTGTHAGHDAAPPVPGANRPPPNSNIIHDPNVNIDPYLLEQPFVLAYQPPIERPDSLLPPMWRGRVIYQFFLDADGRPRRVDILRLDLTDASGASVFRGRVREGELSDYPPEVARLVPWLLSYADRVRFRNTSEPGRPPVSDTVTMPMRF